MKTLYSEKKKKNGSKFTTLSENYDPGVPITFLSTAVITSLKESTFFPVWENNLNSKCYTVQENIVRPIVGVYFI